MNLSTHIILFTLWIGGCSAIFVEGDSDLEIRVQNNSRYMMEDVTVVFPADTINYGDISSGKKSDYRNVTKAYRYAYIEIIVDEKELVLQPIDYVGESLLDPGRYTYELTLDKETFNSDDYRHALSLQLSQQ